MNTEQQLRAEAIVEENFKGLGEFIKDKDILYWYKSLIATCMEGFVEQELQRIGEVYVPCTEDEAISAFRKNSDEWKQYTGTQIGWLKKLSLLEVKDLADK